MYAHALTNRARIAIYFEGTDNGNFKGNKSGNFWQVNEELAQPMTNVAKKPTLLKTHSVGKAVAEVFKSHSEILFKDFKMCRFQPMSGVKDCKLVVSTFVGVLAVGRKSTKGRPPKH